jgi:prephenate dehydrogenase
MAVAAHGVPPDASGRLAPLNLALLGCGLVGGSLAAAWRRAGRVARVRAYDSDPRSAAQALALGHADEAAETVAAALAGADCIVLATPVGAMAGLLEAVALHARADAVVTDVGSTKQEVSAHARRLLGATYGRFVAAHPIAGGALPGIAHASAALFTGRWVITTPDADTDAGALALVEANWAACGARIERMCAAEHDRIFASVSHLPHLLAFALVHQIAGQADGARQLKFAGAGFRDFSRIAASDPAMWRDIALANRAALGGALEGYRRELDALQAAVDAGDGAALDAIFARASRLRREQRFDAAGPEHRDD